MRCHRGSWIYIYFVPVQSVPKVKVVSSNFRSIQHYVIKFVSDLQRLVVFSGYSGFVHQ